MKLARRASALELAKKDTNQPTKMAKRSGEGESGRSFMTSRWAEKALTTLKDGGRKGGKEGTNKKTPRKKKGWAKG